MGQLKDYFCDYQRIFCAAGCCICCAVFVIVSEPAQAKFWTHSPLGATHHKKQKPPPVPAEVEKLIRVLAARPELMNLNYLEPELGRPENERSQSTKLLRKYFWYDSVSHTPLYQLNQKLLAPSNSAYQPEWIYSPEGRVTNCSFTVFSDQLNLKPADLQELFGPSNKSCFDPTGMPCELYYSGPNAVPPSSFAAAGTDNNENRGKLYTAPNTTVSFCTPHGRFRVSKVTISCDAVAPLPPPNQADMYSAQEAVIKMAAKELDAHDWHAAEGHLRRHLRDYPQDAAVHFELAQTLREEGEINDAISEYRQALSFAGSNEDLRQKCIEGLQNLKVPTGPGTVVH